MYGHFCNNNHYMKNIQFPLKSFYIELASIKLVDYLVKNIDGDFIPCSIYLDLLKTFDTVNFSILIYKFKFYRNTGTPLKLQNNYL